VNNFALTIGYRQLSCRMTAWSLRVAAVLVVGLVFSLFSSEEAFAVSNEEVFQPTSTLCIKERVATYTQADGVLYGQARTRPYTGSCSVARTKPAGDIAARAFAYKWNNSDARWQVCRNSGWVYNTESASQVLASVKLGREGHRRCGKGWYATFGQGAVFQDGQWRYTGLVWSGQDYFK
jgi:hypothetical protein